jgi:hypothetical protein
VHPHTFYSTLFDHERRDEVFVVMSFAPAFAERWVRVIEPMIREDLGLKAYRVDDSISGESVVKDILDGIAHARLVLADITSTWMTDPDGQAWPQRNGNVMWEVGIAHTMRMPDEVILVRSDADQSIFDLTQFRAFQYEPTNIPRARKFLKELCQDRLRSIDQAKSEHVRRSAESLHPIAARFLIFSVPHNGTPFQTSSNMPSAIGLPTLFSLGIIKIASFTAVPTQQTNGFTLEPHCVITPFGQAVVKYIGDRVAVSPELRSLIEAGGNQSSI